MRIIDLLDERSIELGGQAKNKSDTLNQMVSLMVASGKINDEDFFSIGTNDLTKYTLAIDRQNPKLDSIYDSHHEGVLRMLKMVVDNGHKEGCWVGICGELGADLSLTETFIDMGFDELSVTPSMVLPVRDVVRNI